VVELVEQGLQLPLPLAELQSRLAINATPVGVNPKSETARQGNKYIEEAFDCVGD